MGQRSKVASGDQILTLEATDPSACSTCRESVEVKIVSGIRMGGKGAAQCQTLRLCNVCLSWLRELISAHEATPTAVRSLPALCTACGHSRDSHYVKPGFPGCSGCTACPGYAGPT